jgi:uncharacterized protein DUF222
MSPPVEPELRRLQDVADVLWSVLHQLEPTHLGAEEAGDAVRGFAEIERLAVAGKTLAARQVERSGSWRMNGYRTCAHWVASITGVPVGQAVGTLDTGRRLEQLPETSWAFSNGELSEAKVRAVASAAEAAPARERELLQAARTETVTALKERCSRVKATAARDERAAYDRIHVRRYLRHWTDAEGAFRLEARLTADAGARVLAGLEPHKERIFHQARKEGRRESSEAYAADALVALAEENSDHGGPNRSGRSGPRATVHVRVDHSALLRGHVMEGETCEIPGVGPIPVAAARSLATDAFLKVLVSKGTDVAAVAHVGRTIPSRVRTALEARDPTCVVPACDVRRGLEIDHIVPFAGGGPTTLANLARLCSFHHYLKTYHGYRLAGSVGEWTWSGPDPPPG